MASSRSVPLFKVYFLKFASLWLFETILKNAFVTRNKHHYLGLTICTDQTNLQQLDQSRELLFKLIAFRLALEMGKKLNDERRLEATVIDTTFEQLEDFGTEPAQSDAAAVAEEEPSGKPKAPDGGYGWVILIAAFVRICWVSLISWSLFVTIKQF